MLTQEKSRVVETLQCLAPRALCYRAGRGADSRERAGGRPEEVSSLGKIGKARAEPGGRAASPGLAAGGRGGGRGPGGMGLVPDRGCALQLEPRSVSFELSEAGLARPRP